ncbi:MAG: hypothetical protein ACHP9Z_05365 [Streptosporangiales bacterium]
MCSTSDPRLDRIGTAIDEIVELAAEVAAADADGTGTLAGRLTEVWAMVADLDPGLARRLPGYTAAD